MSMKPLTAEDIAAIETAAEELAWRLRDADIAIRKHIRLPPEVTRPMGTLRAMTSLTTASASLVQALSICLAFDEDRAALEARVRAESQGGAA